MNIEHIFANLCTKRHLIGSHGCLDANNWYNNFRWNISDGPLRWKNIHEQKYKRHTRIVSILENIIENVYLRFTFCCYSTVHFCLEKKRSSKDPVKSQAIRQWWVAKSMSHNQYRVCPSFVWCPEGHLHHINITRLSIVTCRMFSHSSWAAIHSWLLFAGSGCKWTYFLLTLLNFNPSMDIK